MPNTKVVFDWEVEVGKQSVTYAVRAEVSPKEPCVMWGDGAHPGSDAQVESKEVWYVHQEPCRHNSPEKQKSCQLCRGKGTVKIEDRRPEFDDLVDDEEVMKNLPDGPDEPDKDED